MAELFEVKEAVQIAVEDEKTGVAFYTALGEKTGEPATEEHSLPVTLTQARQKLA